VYTCKPYPASGWCAQAGYEPGTGSAWQQAWTLEGSCDITKTFSPTASPVSSLPNQGGCPVAYAKEVPYVAGDLVSKSGMVFKCNGYPLSLFCAQSGYEPLIKDYGDAYKLAWTTLGPCSGTIAPVTASPLTALQKKTAGCPATYISGTTYRAGDVVAKTTSNTAVVKKYECKAWPNSLYCNSATYAPGGQFGYMAWIDLGQCSGTFSPTVTLWCNYWKNNKLYPSKVWSASTTYAVGDEVIVLDQAFKCKIPGWCNQAAYAPALSAGTWSSAWTAVGTCKDNTYAPSSNPSSNPSGNPSSKPTPAPTRSPTNLPTSAPTSSPTNFPTSSPTSSPTGCKTKGGPCSAGEYCCAGTSVPAGVCPGSLSCPA